jgi:hypothetical protein
MFKKTLLAVTLAALSTSAMAVDVQTSGTVKFGTEALTSNVVKNDFTALTTPNVALTLSAAFSVGDIIKVQVSGGKFKKTDSFSLTSSVDEGVGGNNANDDAGSVSTGFLSATDTELVFRVTGSVPAGVDAVDATIKDVITLTLGTPAVSVNSTAKGAKVSISASAETSSGVAIDVTGASDSKEIIQVVQEHTFVSTKLTDKIDVADERKSLFGTTDSFTITYTEDAVDASADFPLADVSFTVNGSFTGFEAGTTGATNLGAVSLDHKTGGAANKKVQNDLQSLVIETLAAPVNGDTSVFLFTPDVAISTRVVLNSSTYSTDVTIKSGTTTLSYNGLKSGGFVLNGASATYAYAPLNYSGAVTTQFEIANSGVVDGEITVTGFDTAGTKYEGVLPFNAEAGKLTSVSDAAITSALGLTGGTKLQLSFTVNAPENDITFGGYSNRGTTGRMALTPEV